MKSAVLKMDHKIDPKKEIMEKIGDLSGIELMHNNILVATYVRPEKTASGIIMTDKFRKEDEYQGKVGLVIKKGPLAFKDDGPYKWHGQDVEPGEWVWYRISDGWQMTINGVHCRVFEEAHIRGKLASPDLIL